jgi:phage N-6-adenine-methyltransferase
MNTALMFSTGKDDWATPPELFDSLHAEFGFVLDAAATSANAKCRAYFGPDHRVPEHRDALGLDWSVYARYGGIWINPPYSRGLQGKFIAKAAEAARDDGATVVMLLPARPDTKAFHDHIWDREHHRPRPGVQVRFIKGRVRFVGAPASAPFPSMIVVFGS